MTLFGLLAVDDLARVAIKTLAKHKETEAIADSIAHDFKDMGVAFADDAGGDYYISGRGARHILLCQGCVRAKENELQVDATLYNGCTDAASAAFLILIAAHTIIPTYI